MSIFRRIGEDLKEAFGKTPFVSSMLHLDVILIFGALAFMLVCRFLNLGIIEDFIGAFDWYLFILGLLMAWANGHTQFVYGGLLGYAGYLVIALFASLIQGWGFGFGTLVSALIYGGLGYLVLTKVKD